MSDLAKLRGIARDEGMDIQAQTATAQALEQARQQEQSQRQAVEMGMQRRGIAGGGLEFALKQQAQQASANDARRALQEQAAESNRRALQALYQGSQMAGQLSAEDIALQSDKAKAQDMINKFNTMVQQDVQRRNVAAKNMAELENLRGREAMQRANIDKINQQRQAALDATQQEFQNRLQRGAAAKGMAPEIAQMQQRQGQVAAGQAAAPYEAITKGLSTFGDLYTKSNQEDDAKLR